MNVYVLDCPIVWCSILTGLDSQEEEQHGSLPRTLVVGDLQSWKAHGRVLPQMSGLIFVDVASLSADLLAETQPDVILSPLVAREFDAIELARQLYALGYGGRYRVITDRLPDDQVVHHEIATVAPGLNFEMLSLPGAASD